MTAFLILVPEESGYAVTPPSTTLRVALDGGAGRYRLDVLNGTFLVDVNYQCDLNSYDYLLAFYRTVSGHGTIPFQTNLILDTAGINTYTAQFIPNSIKLISIQGYTYTVSAQLEVWAMPDDTAYDTAVTEVYYAASLGTTPVTPDVYLSLLAALAAKLV